MVPPTSRSIPTRLRRVDSRIAKIDRRLGYLQGRVYFNPNGVAGWEEVEIFSFDDQGITPENTSTGEEVSAHRFSLKVSKDWVESHVNMDGTWGIARIDSIPSVAITNTNEPLSTYAVPIDELIECESENESWQDGETFVTLTLRVVQTISMGIN